MIGCKDVPDTFSSKSSLYQVWEGGYNAGWKHCDQKRQPELNAILENERKTWIIDCRIFATIGFLAGAALATVITILTTLFISAN